MTNTENYSPDHVAVVATAGLTLSVYRTAEFPDCSLDGITSRVARLTLVGTLDCTVYRSGFVYPAPASMRVVTPRDNAPAVALEINHAPFRKSATDEPDKRVHLTPVHWDTLASRYVRTHPWTMAGGNYATTSDSRLSELLEDALGHTYGPLSVHDRVEH
ncbi:hypothetical protein JWS13_04225 (plasmid) [Rhodococcus pseudokoreensis]|uniref:YjbR protein n=1 Tax=Rhodococcus pseudokoreensis TaxID=2811421 RepID=A0A974VYH4_9NOCA|nr:hypothetical protein [Rhodococcus pseudokoreensis]QSE87923.1 hypothetical protein JWS13_04225 [Rhodococcus pseudokoreensis]